MGKIITATVTLLLLLTSLAIVALGPVKSVSGITTITIRADGSIYPADVPIRRDGDTFTFSGNVEGYLDVSISNVKLDGAGFTLAGHLSLSGASIRVTGVTVANRGMNYSFDGITIHGSGCMIIQNTIFAEGAGILIAQSSNNVITDNNVDAKVRYGIELQDSHGNAILRNNVKSRTEDGVCLSNSDTNTISGNNLTSVRLYHSSGNTIDRNNVYEGFSLKSSSLNNITRNRIIDYNKLTPPTPLALGRGNIQIEDSNGNFVGSNTLANSGGIFLSHCTRNTFRNNSISRNGVCFDPLGNYPPNLDLFLNEVDASNMVNGKPIYYLVGKSSIVIDAVNYPDPGLLILVNCYNVTVRNQVFSNQGVLLAYTTNSTITNNTIIETCTYGVQLISSTGNSITKNSITRNSYGGILLHSSSQNFVFGNEIAGNRYSGIGLTDGAHGNKVVANNVANQSSGIGFSLSSNNTLYHNNFVGNTLQVYDRCFTQEIFFKQSPSVNVWSNGKEGNYWSNYTGKDLDGNRIGDTAHVIYDQNIDPYPLVKPVDISKGGPDFTEPKVFILSPANITYNENRIQLNFTVDETYTQISYSLDGQANVTVNDSILLPDMLPGRHNITVYVTDEAGNIGASETIYFAIAEASAAIQLWAFAAVSGIAIAAAVGLLAYFRKRKERV